MTTLTHKIRLTPTLEQRQALLRACGCSRFAWNWALARYKELKGQGVARVSMNDLKKEFNQIKREQFPWIYESPKDSNQQPFANLKKALTRCYESKGGRKVGLPKFKKRGEHDSFYLSNDKFWVKGSVANLYVIGKVTLAEPLRFTGKVLSGTVSRTADDWFLSIQVQLPDTYTRSSENTGDDTIGIDLGLKTFVVTSDGEEVAAPKPLKKYLKRLRCLSKAHSRKVKGSNNRRKATAKLASLHQRIASIRLDFLHKLTTRLLRENQTVVVEDLNVKAMTKLWGRAISDVSFAEFRRQLTYKSPLFGRELVITDRWFASSKMCSDCGAVRKELKLSDREHVCPSCGSVKDRDLNAALNLKNWGLAHQNKLGTVSAEVTPAEIAALASPSGEVKLWSMKQESLGSFALPRK